MSLSRGDIVARLERLPPSGAVWRLVALISLGGAFEFYDLMMTAYISPVLAKAGVFQKHGLFGLPDQASFVAATFLGLLLIPVFYVAVRRMLGDKLDETTHKLARHEH